MVIIKKKNGEIRETERTVALEEKVINGIKCYIPVGNDDYDEETIFSQKHCMLVEIYGHFYAYDVNEEGGKTTFIYSFTDKCVIEHEYDYLELKKDSNKWYAYGYNHLGIRKGIYLFEHNIWLKVDEEAKDYLEEPQEFFNKQYIYYKREDDTHIDIYDIEKKKWIDAKRKVAEINKIVKGIFLNQAYAYVIKQQEEDFSAIYDFNKEMWYYSYGDFVKLVQLAGKPYIYVMDKKHRNIGIFDVETNDKIYTSYDLLELKEIEGKAYAEDIGDGKVLRVYNFAIKKWITRHWNHLKIVDNCHVCDMNEVGEIKRVYTFDSDKYITSGSDYHFKFRGCFIYCCDVQGNVVKKYSQTYLGNCSERDD